MTTSNPDPTHDSDGATTPLSSVAPATSEDIETGR